MEETKDQSADRVTSVPVNNSKDYIENHVDKSLHEALADKGLIYSPSMDCFTERKDSCHDDDDPSSHNQRFAKALQEYEETVNPKYRTGFHLENTYTWDDVLAKVELARNKYEGDEKGKKKKNLVSLRHRLRSFSKAAPGVQGWLNLLPGDSLYASVFCGGLGLILTAAIQLGQLREDTCETLDQIPLLIERAEDLVRTYGGNMEEHVVRLYKAILDVLQHILRWYKGKAGCLKFFAAFCKGSTYAATLKAKMEEVRKASGVIDDAAGMGIHQRLKDIQEVTSDTKIELRKLTLDVKNHLYKVLRDADAMQKFMQMRHGSADPDRSTESSSKKSSKSSRKETFARRERDALLRKFEHDQDMLMRDVEDALHGLKQLRLGDADRVAAIIEHDAVQDWISSLKSQALLVHGNCRRVEISSPTSAATAMLVRGLFDKFFFKASNVKVAILYWFCGSNIHGFYGSTLGMVRSLICQLLCGPFEFDLKSYDQAQSDSFKDLLDLLVILLRQLPEDAVVICFIDGISYYEGDQQRNDTCQVVSQLSNMVKSEDITLKLLMTSTKRTSFLLEDRRIAKRVQVVEIPQHVAGSKLGVRGDWIL